MRSVSIGTWFGFRMQVHWSWLIIFALITWNLTALFQGARPGWSTAAAVAVAAGASLALFLSVLLHELSHAAVARARGLEVRDITLFLFGGVASIERDSPDARTEFLVAVVGPITSFAIGIVALAGSGALTGGVDVASVEAARELDVLQLALLWVGQVNIVLALFNLVPGFPLDGGRILRSILWGATRSRQRATRWAAAAGQLVGGGLVLAGIAMALGYDVPFFGSGTFGGVWLVLIGMFLFGAASAERRAAANDAGDGDAASIDPTQPGEATR